MAEKGTEKGGEEEKIYYVFEPNEGREEKNTQCPSTKSCWVAANLLFTHKQLGSYCPSSFSYVVYAYNPRSVGPICCSTKADQTNLSRFCRPVAYLPTMYSVLSQKRPCN
jgi:hypothetical protein